MKALVFGGNGFLGSSLLEEFLRRGYETTAFDLKSQRNNLLKERGIRIIEGDLLNLDKAKIPFEGMDWVVNLASITTPAESIKNPDRDGLNYPVCERIFKEALSAGVKKIFYPSSGGTIYGSPEKIPVDENYPPNPTIPYAVTKLKIERRLAQMCEGSGTIPLIFRYGNPYGPNQYPGGGTGVITAWLEAIRDGKRIDLFGSEENARDFFFVKDATDACLTALNSPKARGVYNIGSGKPTTLRTIIETMKQVTGRKVDVNALPPRPNDKVSRIALDIRKAEREFGWKPKVGLAEGIEKTWRWVLDGEPFTI